MNPMPHGRELFSHFLSGHAMSRPVMMPFLDALAASISGASYAAMINAPAVWSGALMKSAELLGADGIIAGYDPAIVAEALGATISWREGQPEITAPANELSEDFLASPRLVSAIETIRRIASGAGRRLACIAAVVGPQTLARQVFGIDGMETGIKQLKPHLAAIAEALLKTQPDLLMLVERLSPDSGGVSPGAARIYNTLRNLAAHYNVPTAVYAAGYVTDTLHQVSALKMDVYILGRDLHGHDPDLATALALGADSIGTGIGIRLDDTARAGAIIEAAMAACHSGHHLLLTSLETVDKGADLQSVRSMLNKTLN